MKTKDIRKTRSYSKIKRCTNFLSWLIYEANFPYIPKGDEAWFKYCGSNHRIQFWRIFGHEFETEYLIIEE